MLHFRLADDQGSALPFPSHPDLVIHPSAFTPEQMKDLVAYGRNHGVELIPHVLSRIAEGLALSGANSCCTRNRIEARTGDPQKYSVSTV